jgi:DNA (cytosine-5)-methyltransferase 1
MIYFNENEPYAARWLVNLYPEAVVDDRGIEQVSGDTVSKFYRVHLFAGIAGWELALALAGWPENVPVWTGSCPCQPFSTSGKKKGKNDKRHLWPQMQRLIIECRPAIVFGEQVASKLGREWLSGVFTDLEGMGYAVAGADLCAAGVGAPHIRQRLFWVAISRQQQPGRGLYRPGQGAGETRQRPSDQSCGSSVFGGGLGYARRQGLSASEFKELSGSMRRIEGGAIGQSSGSSVCGVFHPALPKTTRLRQQQEYISGSSGSGPTVGLGQPDSSKRGPVAEGGLIVNDGRDQGWEEAPSGHSVYCPNVNPWSDYELLHCLDGKARRTKPGIYPLAPGFSGRVGKLRAYGNAIVPQVAAVFIKSVMEILEIV